jgi:3-hydroxy-3-methylglutaryl CoA synthase
MNLTKKVILFMILALLPAFCLSLPQEGRVNQKKIDREREKKRKADVKEYEKAVKHHKKIQSKETKASMKRTKKESRKATPLRP